MFSRDKLCVLTFENGFTSISSHSLNGYLDPRLNINFQRGTWDYVNQKDIPIGEMRDVGLDNGTKRKIIGIYNISDASHMEKMLKDTETAKKFLIPILPAE